MALHLRIQVIHFINHLKRLDFTSNVLVVWLFGWLFVCLFVWLSVCLSVSLVVWLFGCLLYWPAGQASAASCTTWSSQQQLSASMILRKLFAAPFFVFSVKKTYLMMLKGGKEYSQLCAKFSWFLPAVQNTSIRVVAPCVQLSRNLWNTICPNQLSV